ncbi:hypothetical protein HBB16_20425 [Pseudonocardia sp. MCCB 268]|nr:hypothetical protein [Pseudonocardia cytotoxica]
MVQVGEQKQLLPDLRRDARRRRRGDRPAPYWVSLPGHGHGQRRDPGRRQVPGDRRVPARHPGRWSGRSPAPAGSSSARPSSPAAPPPPSSCGRWGEVLLHHPQVRVLTD